MVRIVNWAIVVTIFIGSACGTALLTLLLVHHGLGVPASVLSLNALISAVALAFVLLVAIFAGADESER